MEVGGGLSGGKREIRPAREGGKIKSRDVFKVSECGAPILCGGKQEGEKLFSLPFVQVC